MNIAVEVDEESLGMDVRLIVLTSATSACPINIYAVPARGVPGDLLNIWYSTIGHANNHKQRIMARLTNPDARCRCYVYDMRVRTSPNGGPTRVARGAHCSRRSYSQLSFAPPPRFSLAGLGDTTARLAVHRYTLVSLWQRAFSQYITYNNHYPP